MAENSKIEWTDHTFNPWRGCTKVSPGCQNCYAEALSKRTGHGEYKRGVPRERTSSDNWRKPLKWNRTGICDCGLAALLDGTRCHGAALRRPRVFCASLSDWLDDEVPIEWLTDLLKLIHDTPNLDWLLLTKRPENWRQRIDRAYSTRYTNEDDFLNWLGAWIFSSRAPQNVWIGTTVEDQKRADERIPELLKIPAKIRFLSVEPMLQEISLTSKCDIHADEDGPHRLGFMVGPDDEKSTLFPTRAQALRESGIHWIINGFESGSRKRPGDLAWMRSLRDQCQEAGVKYFCKQIDKVQPIPTDLMIREFPV